MDHSPSGSSAAPDGATGDSDVDALLELESLDADSLFAALTGVEKASLSTLHGQLRLLLPRGMRRD